MSFQMLRACPPMAKALSYIGVKYVFLTRVNL